MHTFAPEVAPVGDSLFLSALVGIIPLLVFFVMLAVFRTRAQTAGAAALVVAIVVAIFGFKMPADFALLSATQGAAFGLVPILYIVIMAIWLYGLTVRSGRFEDLRSIFDLVGHGDIRVQAILIAFCFGGLLEALAGFGAPVAITATMLMALGVKPLKAATTVLVANTAPVAFGAIATPITTAAQLSGLHAEHIGAIVGRQSPLLAWFIPFLLLFLLDGIKGIKQLWPLTLVVGVCFSVAQYFCANHFSYELTDIVAALVGMAMAVIFMMFFKPKGADEARERMGIEKPKAAEKLSGARIWLALFPYILLVVVFGVAKLVPAVAAGLKATDAHIPWPGLAKGLVDADGNPLKSGVFELPWLSSPGFLLLLTGVIVTIVYSVCSSGDKFTLTPAEGVKELGATIVKMGGAILTIVLVLALAYVMNFSGQTKSVGVFLAQTGPMFALLSPVLGWIGTAVTGSDTSANALFASLQNTAATGAGIDPNLTVAANTTGGVVGKLISPQNLAIAATAVNLPGQEATILRKVLGWSVGLLALLCIIVYLQSTPVLGWMISGLN
jgi:lactate permease